MRWYISRCIIWNVVPVSPLKHAAFFLSNAPVFLPRANSTCCGSTASAGMSSSPCPRLPLKKTSAPKSHHFFYIKLAILSVLIGIFIVTLTVTLIVIVIVVAQFRCNVSRYQHTERGAFILVLRKEVMPSEKRRMRWFFPTIPRSWFGSFSEFCWFGIFSEFCRNVRGKKILWKEDFRPQRQRDD